MKLDKQQREEVLRYLGEKWKKPSQCPVCQHTDWGITETTFEIREFLGGSISVGGGSITPIIVVTCDNCGNTLFFNAISLGIVKRPEKETKNE